jgi:hypothetical protein
MGLKTDYEHVCFEPIAGDWLCRDKITEHFLCKIGRYGPAKRYYANTTHGFLDEGRLLELADFVEQLNGEQPLSDADLIDADYVRRPAQRPEALLVTEALALQDAPV